MNKIVCISFPLPVSFILPQFQDPGFPGQWNRTSYPWKIFTATVYQQTAAEYRALCYQAFNLPVIVSICTSSAMAFRRLSLQTWMKLCWITALRRQPCRIGMDYEPVSWFEWTDRSSVKEVPGAGDFFGMLPPGRRDILYHQPG